MIELNKINENCSNVYLIDENTCYGDALSGLNTNFATLTSNLNDLVKQSVKFNDLFTLLSNNSAKIIQTINNVNLINTTYQSPYTTVQTLSSNWYQPFSLYYPKILEINSWYNPNPTFAPVNPYANITSVTTTQQRALTAWLENNFPHNNFAKNQIVYIFVNFYQNFHFTYNFNRTYYEDCRPNVGANISVSCQHCPDTRSYQGCNITGRKCTNAWSYCSHTDHPAAATYGCLGYNGRTLQIYKNQDGYDKILCRVKSYKFINDPYWRLS
jgi:hypothetical protein